jgi:GTPase SAR1 family protein
MFQPLKQTRQLIAAIEQVVQSSPLAAQYSTRVSALASSLDAPCELAVAGRVKAGKSSLINALLGVDLAKTGTTETTATINYIRYGIPDDADKPVRCVYQNGRDAWVSRDFLDALQNHTDDALQQAQGIKHLEFYLPDPRLEKITLVDTPGFDAIVGDDEDGHEKVSNAYLLQSLRDRHSRETEEIAGKADAVIYLIGQVANLTSQRILQEFQAASGGSSSAMNAIGVMAKVDITDAVLEQRHSLAASAAEKLSHQLNTIVPVSAGIRRALDQLRQGDGVAAFQSTLRRIPEKQFNRMMKIEKAYLRKMLTGCPLSVDERKALKGDMPWRVFVVIARMMYQYECVEAEKQLEEYAGMNFLNQLLDEHFFQRGRILRCNRIVHELLAMLNGIQRTNLYELEQQARQIDAFTHFITSHQQAESTTAAHLMAHVKATCIPADEVAMLKENICMLKGQTEELILLLKQTNDDFKALKLLEENSGEFSEEEATELYRLFGQYAAEPMKPAEIAQRQLYWKREYNWARSSKRKQVAQCAVKKYGLIEE